MSSAAVLTISDRRAAGQAEDRSGPAAVQILRELGLEIAHTAAVPDERDVITGAVQHWINRADLIVTTGGTGIAERDVTPEAIRPLIERDLPGFGEIMRTASFDKTPLSIISRGGAGIAGQTLIVTLPGSPKGVRECLDLLGPAIRHVLKILAGRNPDCATEQG